VKRSLKNTIPVFDICALSQPGFLQEEVIAERFSEYLDKRPGLHAAHRHSFYHIVLFSKGSGTHSIDFEQFTVRPRSIYFMRPGQVHSWDFKGAPDGYIVNFSAHLFDQVLKLQQYPEQFSFFRGVAGESVVQLAAPLYTEVARLLEQLLEENGTARNADMICALLMNLFIRIERSSTAGQNDKTAAHKQVTLQQFRKLLEAHYTEKRLPKDYAALLYITPNHLNALCKDLLGKPAGTLIRDRVLLEAKRLLVNADLQVAEIAWQLHFEDNSYFSRFFKKYAGQSPEAFRKDHSIH
jgi:AraC family transcriptional regulator, transcriptional activator of pobA